VAPLGIEPMQISINHLQTNGQSKRLNSTLFNIL